MFILHTYVTNNAGQPYLTIEVNWREAFLILWGKRNTPTLCWLPQDKKYNFLLFPLKKIVDKSVNYSLSERKKASLQFITHGKMLPINTPENSP